MIDECKIIEEYESNESGRGMAGILKSRPRIVMLTRCFFSFDGMTIIFEKGNTYRLDSLEF